MNAIDIIKQHIIESGITQSELAKLSGLSFGTINRVLNGKQELHPNTLKKIADALDISMYDLEEGRGLSFNYSVQGYLQYANEITHITSFEQLKKWVSKYEPLVNALPKQAKDINSAENRNAKKVAKATNLIDKTAIDFYREEIIDASSVETWSFRKAEDKRDGFDIDLGNMCTSYPFECSGHTFTNSEALYICGLFSNNTDRHNKIQKKLIEAKSGYDAKKSVRKNYEDEGREDWETFNVDWMKWCVWKKIKGSDDFKQTLLSIPRNAYIIENSTHQKGKTALFWGMSNKELEKKRDVLEKCTVYENPTKKKKDLEVKVMEERNKINHIGTWQGVNCMGKILKYLQLCLLDNIEPSINYDLLRSKEIYLFGELLTFSDEALSVKKPNKVVIFDFDGTLLDTSGWAQYEHLFKEPKRGTKEWEQGRKEYLTHVKDCKQWDGMSEVIDYIRQHHIRTCIVSANTKDRVIRAIKEFGWNDVFMEDDIIGCYALGRKRATKDNGDSSLFAKALEVMKVEAADCLAFGNEISDALAAQNAGIVAYNCLWGATENEAKVMEEKMPDKSLSKPIQIIDIINK